MFSSNPSVCDANHLMKVVVSMATGTGLMKRCDAALIFNLEHMLNLQMKPKKQLHQLSEMATSVQTLCTPIIHILFLRWSIFFL